MTALTGGATPPRPGRVWIITPATRPERFAAALASAADAALLDLEDSVAPADKQTARDTAAQLLDTVTPQALARGQLLGVRVNAASTRDGLADLLALASWRRRANLVLLPKVEAARDIELAAAVLDTPAHAPHLWALVETPRAVTALPAIVTAPRLGGVVFGSADYAAAIGCGLDWSSLRHARCSIVTTAAAAGLPALDAPCFNLDDPDRLHREARLAKKLGFYGKGAVHPRQTAPLQEVFTPTGQEIARARAVIAAGQVSGGGITRVDGQMVGAPFFAAARALLERVDR